MLSSLVTCRFLCLWLCSALYMRCIYPYGLWIHSQRTGHSFIHRSEKINTRKVLRYEFVVTCFIVLCVACINICICTEFRLELNKKRNNNAVEVKIYIATSPPPPPPLPPSLDTHICMYEERANSTMITMFSLIEMFVWFRPFGDDTVYAIHMFVSFTLLECVCLSEWIWNLLVRFASHKLLTVSI